METYLVTCSCGKEAKATYREKDSAWSSYGIWHFYDLDCNSNAVEEPGQMGLGNALKEAQPKCSDCGIPITSSMLKEKL